ncbi:MAG: hypothetical protein HFG49_13230 [Lachnospiraceae bacterium]|jgi:hypothetical protein|nr:hypothetical protein [Lachnospiraceae bacterium]
MENQESRGNEDIGERIRSAVADAFYSMEFGTLNQTIRSTVNAALDEAKKQAENCKSSLEESDWLRKDRKKDLEGMEHSGLFTPVPLNIRVNWKGKVSGILFAVFGGIGSSVFGFLTAASAVTMLVSSWNPFGWWITGLSGMVLASFLVMLGLGIRNNGRIGRLKAYLKELNRQGKPYCQLDQLGKSAAKSLAYVRKDMKKMLELGMLPDARMDDQGTCLMLDEETYRQYRMAQDALKERQRKEKLLQKQKRWEKGIWKFLKTPDADSQESQVQKEEKEKEDIQEGQEKEREGGRELNQPLVSEAIARGRQYMNQLDKIREAMKGQTGEESFMSEKLLRLDTVLERMFAALEKYPQQLDEMERFMEYYLPTTVKLASAYQEFAQVEFPGENVKNAKEEIRQTMDTINGAFEKLLDDLYQDVAFDVLTDASVLQSMLAREGLTESDFA